MKLYYKPGACSLSPHIVFRELDIPFDMVLVDHRAKTIVETGESYVPINPKGGVPFFELDDGEILTEGAALLQYLCDKKPEMGLMPERGTMEHYRALEWLSFIGSDFHKGFGWIFNPMGNDRTKEIGQALLNPRFELVSEKLGNNDYLMGDRFMAPDAYFYVILRWALGAELPVGDSLKAYVKRIEARPLVQKTLEIEGIDAVG